MPLSIALPLTPRGGASPKSQPFDRKPGVLLVLVMGAPRIVPQDAKLASDLPPQ